MQNQEPPIAGDFARQRAQVRIGTEHHELVVRPEATALVERLVWHLDEPFADSSALPTYLVAELARPHVKMVLSGDGGDDAVGAASRGASSARHSRSWRAWSGPVQPSRTIGCGPGSGLCSPKTEEALAEVERLDRDHALLSKGITRIDLRVAGKMAISVAEVKADDGKTTKKIKVSGSTVTWGEHISAAQKSGVTMLLFGAGVGESTDGIGGPPSDDWWWITKAQEFLAGR